jgi:hypothetical protein
LNKGWISIDYEKIIIIIYKVIIFACELSIALKRFIYNSELISI